MSDPRRCVVLVPVAHHIEPSCETVLRELERRGYDVRRVYGYAAIDQGRSQMASDALAEGFDETLWIDADIQFQPDDVERLRSHMRPVTCGIYPKKGMRALAVHVLPGTEKLVLGAAGGLTEILYAATGFLHVRREVYLALQHRLNLPICNSWFGRAIVPYFLPMIHPTELGPWYLGEDYAFCERVRQCGFPILADTRIRLGHVGSHAFSWEEAGSATPRYATYNFQLSDAKPQRETAQREGTCFPIPEVDALRDEYPWPAAPPDVPVRPQQGWLHDSTRELLALLLSDRTRLVVELGSWLGLSTRYIADRAPRASIVAIDHWRGSPEHQQDQYAPLLPILYETFLRNCWDYRQQIVPLRTSTQDGLRLLSSRGVAPELIYVDADHGYDAARADVALACDLFPSAVVVGDDWDWDSVRQAVVDEARQRGRRVEVHGVAWRLSEPVFQQPP
jgi:methyltransferase family protein